MNQLVHADVIPDGWVKKPLFDMCRFIPGKAHEPFIDPLGEFTCVNSKFISTEGQVAKTCNRSITPAKVNDILMVMSDLPNGRALAKCYLVGEHERLAVNQRVCILRPKQGFDAQMLFHILNRHPYFMAFDDGVNQTHLLNGVFEKCVLAVPDDPEEQRHLGQALSDADGVVEGLERLIAKKRRIKQGAMQDLLTAKRRLPGFSGEWVVKTLQDLCSQIQDGTHFTPTYVDMGIPFYSVENITARNFDECKFVTPEAHAAMAKRCLPKPGDILMTRIGSIGDTYLVDWNHEASIYVSLCLLRPSPSVDALYLYAYSRSSMFVKGVEDRSLPNAIPKKINLGDIADVEVSMPIDPAEQSAIAFTLNDMDAEITALEARLHKARAIKEGMMQNLLTGRTRLV
ncbi:restriction endonuclease subunit S [Celeribacter sp.]|uniref:restriction endonuclease subunit S n=1 Tax=Celeribacter sp. TaxID=1890673 RepID=UPI003A928CB7